MSHPRKHFSLLLKTFGNFGFDLLSGEGARDRVRLLESLGRACSLTVDFLERPSRLSSTLGLIERSSLTFDFSFSLALDFFGLFLRLLHSTLNSDHACASHCRIV